MYYIKSKTSDVIQKEILGIMLVDAEEKSSVYNRGKHTEKYTKTYRH